MPGKYFCNNNTLGRDILGGFSYKGDNKRNIKVEFFQEIFP